MWARNRFRGDKAGPPVISSLIGTLLAFGLCTLFGPGPSDRKVWTGSWESGRRCRVRAWRVVPGHLTRCLRLPRP